MDFLGRDISSLITSTPSQAINTSHPTDPANPITITYSVKDAGSLLAVAAIRKLTVACPDGQVPCKQSQHSTDGSSYVSSSNTAAGDAFWVCLTDVVCSLGSSLSATASATAEQNSTTASPPVLSLVGPATVYLQLLQTYKKCEKTDPLTAVCDRGVTATDDMDGDLAGVVEVCRANNSSSSSSGNMFSAYGLEACGMATNKPGTFDITFSVTNSQGLSASVTRQVVVQGGCLASGSGSCDSQSCLEGGSALQCITDVSHVHLIQLHCFNVLDRHHGQLIF